MRVALELCKERVRRWNYYSITENLVAIKWFFVFATNGSAVSLQSITLTTGFITSFAGSCTNLNNLLLICGSFVKDGFHNDVPIFLSFVKQIKCIIFSLQNKL